MGTGGGERLGGGRANPAARSGDERNFPVEGFRISHGSRL
jgi:hypothetical protein